MGRKARAVILTHLHGHPHVLLFKPTDRGRDSGRPAFKLPGGALNTGESETEGLQVRRRCPSPSHRPEQP